MNWLSCHPGTTFALNWHFEFRIWLNFYANQLDFSVILLFLKGNIHVLTVLVWFSSFHSMWDKIITFVKKLIQKFYFSILDWPKQLCYMLFNKMMKKLRLYWCTGYHGLYYIYKVAQTQCLFFHREVFLRWFNQPLVNCVM